MKPEILELVKKIAELTEDDPFKAVFTNNHDFWVIINGYPCMVAPTNDSIYIENLQKEDLIF